MGVDPYIGEVSIFAGNYAPRGWELCWGQLLAINEYTALFSLLGTYYGGDGRTTFGLPDLRGRSVVGAGSGPGLTPRSIGQKAGYERVTLSTANMAVHNHAAETSVAGTMSAQLKCITDPGTSASPSGGYIARHSDTDLAFQRSGTIGNMNADAVEVNTSALSATTTVENAGGGQAHENMHPWQSINYIIALQGIFPPRN
jgi:microcystin-dependent protein